jgi:LacI family trehalose operon transcriptional repressor
MTIYDIAKLANVSKSTVSRVINNDPNTSIKVREKIWKIIEENNYTPNKNARNINKVQKKTILVLMTRLNSFSENKVLHGLVSAATDSCEYMIFETNFDINQTEEIINAHTHVDGIIIFAIGKQNYQFIDDVRVPVIFIGQKVYNKNSIYFNDYEAMQTLMKEIDQQNLNKILYIGIDTSDPTTGLIRQYSVLNYCDNHQISYDIITTKLEELTNNYEVLKDIDLHQYSAIVCATDMISLYVYKLLLKNNLTNIQLTGIGNNTDINFIIEDLLTIEHDYFQAGIDAFDIIINNIKHIYIKENYLLKKIDK